MQIVKNNKLFLSEATEADRINDLFSSDDPVELYDFGDDNLYSFDGQNMVVYRKKEQSEIDDAKNKPLSNRAKIAKDLLGDIEEDPEVVKARVAKINSHRQDSNIVKGLTREAENRISKIRKRRNKETAEKERKNQNLSPKGSNQNKFLPELLGFIKRRYGPAIREYDTRSKLSRNYVGTNMLVSGHREESEDKIPHIFIYIDYSGSIGPIGAKQAEEIKKALKSYEKAGKLITTIKYFDTEIHDVKPDSMGGTDGSKVLDDIEKEKISSNLENVIIMTDNGFCSKENDRPVSVKGMVWLLFKDGQVDRLLVDQLAGQSYPYQKSYAWDYAKGLRGQSQQE